VTAFFIPDVPRGELEPTYERIRKDTEARTGHAVSGRRIAAIECRRGGRDCELKVGRRDPDADRVVVAIFDLGREVYAVRCQERGRASRSDWIDPVVVGKHQVYSVTDFG
jgi:hypothetical protein